ncbi:class D sortase [Fredinandcohnia onubensis]|uniref:class D sortase n=1 Tax=Fredinandcohnia onubensis TaxID=1571209 RepID=UPI000C0BC114|nr:class D sortase [Fredinandcohnia onubensis]
MKKRKSKWRWVILGFPISIILLGIGIIGYFGWDMTKQTVLLTKTVVDPYVPENPDRELEKEVAWSTLPSPGQKIGDLSIPAVELSYPVVQGTHTNELKKGIGHFAGSTLPGQGGHVILSGHRETHFTELEHLEIGDQITFTTPYGDFVYETTEFKIVHADDETVAVPTDFETLTLTTCYPFNFIGDAPDRFVVYTKLIENPMVTMK